MNGVKYAIEITDKYANKRHDKTIVTLEYLIIVGTSQKSCHGPGIIYEPFINNLTKLSKLSRCLKSTWGRPSQDTGQTQHSGVLSSVLRDSREGNSLTFGNSLI